MRTPWTGWARSFSIRIAVALPLLGLAGGSGGLGCASMTSTLPTLEPRLHTPPPPVVFQRPGASPAMVEADTLACHEVAHHLVMGPAPLALEPMHTQRQQIQDTLHLCMEKRGYTLAPPLRLALAGSGKPAAPGAPPAGAPGEKEEAEEAPSAGPSASASVAADPGGGDGGGDGGGEDEGDDEDE